MRHSAQMVIATGDLYKSALAATAFVENYPRKCEKVQATGREEHPRSLFPPQVVGSKANDT